MNRLGRDLAFQVFVSSYVERRALALMQTSLEVGVAEAISLPVNSHITRPIVEVYKRASCWTWFDDWVWPKDESFLRLEAGEPIRPFPAPFQLFST